MNVKSRVNWMWMISSKAYTDFKLLVSPHICVARNVDPDDDVTVVCVSVIGARVETVLDSIESFL